MNNVNNKKDKKHLVMAYCREKINNEHLYKMSQLYDKIFIYSKCGDNLNLSLMMKNIYIIRLDNIGSCDYAFMVHIIQHYNNLPEILVFSKPSNLNYYQNPTNTFTYNSLGIGNFKLDDWNFTNNKNLKFVKSDYNNLSEWLKFTLGEEYHNWCLKFCKKIQFGGYFMVDSNKITQHSLDVYKCLIFETNNANEELSHHLERTWGLLFTNDINIQPPELNSHLLPIECLAIHKVSLGLLSEKIIDITTMFKTKIYNDLIKLYLSDSTFESILPELKEKKLYCEVLTCGSNTQTKPGYITYVVNNDSWVHFKIVNFCNNVIN